MDVDDPPRPLAVLWTQLQSPSKRSEQIASGQEWCKANVKWTKGRTLSSWNGLKMFDAFLVLQQFFVTPAFNAAAIASCSASPSGVVWASASADSRPGTTPVMPRQLRRKNREATKWNALKEIERDSSAKTLTFVFSLHCLLHLRLHAATLQFGVALAKQPRNLQVQCICRVQQPPWITGHKPRNVTSSASSSFSLPQKMRKMQNNAKASKIFPSTVSFWWIQ